MAAVAALALTTQVVRADDVDIESNVATGVDLDAETGSTVRIFPGVTVTNTIGSPPVKASTQPWTLTNQGIVEVVFADGVAFSAGGTVINQGTVSAFNGVRMSAGGSVTNTEGATITAAASGIWIDGGQGTVSNAGMIIGEGFADTVGLESGAVTNLATGVIENRSGGNAVTNILGTAPRSVINYGSIVSDDGGYGTGVVIQEGGVTNHAGGTITATYNAIWAISGGPSTIVNDGTLTSVGSDPFSGAIEMQEGGSVDNFGTIEGQHGISVLLGFGVTEGSTAIINSGTVTGTGGNAILFANGTNSLTLMPTSILNGDVVGGAGSDTLAFDGGPATTGTFDFDTNGITGFETGRKLGLGTWILKGTAGSGLTGNFEVEAGGLFVNGLMAATTFDIFSGTLLGGIGTIGGLMASGTVSPGNSIGTLIVDGDASFGLNSTFRVEIDPTSGDRLDVTGAATIDSTAMVEVLPASGVYADGSTYLILDALSRSGEFGGIIDNSTFLDFMLDYSIANQVWLTITTVTSFPDIAETPNQFATATAIQDLGGGNPVFDVVLTLPDDDAARAAFDNLSGEIHATVLGVVFDSPWFREGIMNRLRRTDEPPAIPSTSGGDPATPAWAWWAVLPQGYGATSRRDGDGNAAAADISTGGLMLGADRDSGSGRAGFAFGYQQDAIDVADRGSHADIDSWHVGLYGSLEHDGWRSRGGGAFTWHHFDVMRDITVPDLEGAAWSNPDGWTAQGFAEIGRPFEFPAGGRIEPFAGLRYVASHRGAFTEDGAGAADLSGDDAVLASLISTLGASASTSIPLADGVNLKPEITLAWQHAFSDVTPGADFSFDATSETFHVLGPGHGSDGLRVHAGASLALSDRASGFLAYEGVFARGASDQALRAGTLIHF
jgi:uncharacterized protein with beta-barrel porin domain